MIRCGLGGIVLSLFISASVNASIITVNSLGDAQADDGSCTLREAIVAANTDTASGITGVECAAGAGDDVIAFDVAGTIQPASALPQISSTVHINGYTAPGASQNTDPLITNAVLTVEIDGANAGNVPGLHLVSAAGGSIIEGLVINNSANPTCCFQSGILLEQVSSGSPTILRGNFIGTDPSGTVDLGKGAAGYYIDGSNNVIIGSDTGGDVDPAARNLVSGNNTIGIVLYVSTNVRVLGNLVGTRADGEGVVLGEDSSTGNSGAGIHCSECTQSVISYNLSSGNGSGIEFSGSANNVLVQGNMVGTNAGGFSTVPDLNAGGFSPVPNLNGGIRVTDNPNFNGILISDLDIWENLVAYNLCGVCSGGIEIQNVSPNNDARGIRLYSNLVHSNEGLEIELAPLSEDNFTAAYGVTDNDPDDTDTGPNELQNFPVVTSVVVDASAILMIDFTLDSTASVQHTVEFFYTTSCDDSGHGGSEFYIGSVGVDTDANGDAVMQSGFDIAMPPDGYVTATATNPLTGTSEFSACVPVTSGQVQTSATIQVSKAYTDASTDSVNVFLQCAGGVELNAVELGVESGAPAQFTLAGFESGAIDCAVSEVVPAGYAASYDSGIVSELNCDFTSIADGASLDCAITNTPLPDDATVAEIVVVQDFSDDNPTGTEVHLDCNDGSGANQVTLVAEGSPVSLFVSLFADGTLECSVIEVPTPGYIASYDDGSVSELECRFEGITDGSVLSCNIANLASEVPVLSPGPGSATTAVPTVNPMAKVLMALLLLLAGVVFISRVARG